MAEAPSSNVLGTTYGDGFTFEENNDLSSGYGDASDGDRNVKRATWGDVKPEEGGYIEAFVSPSAKLLQPKIQGYRHLHEDAKRTEEAMKKFINSAGYSKELIDPYNTLASPVEELSPEFLEFEKLVNEYAGKEYSPLDNSGKALVHDAGKVVASLLENGARKAKVVDVPLKILEFRSWNEDFKKMNPEQRKKEILKVLTDQALEGDLKDKFLEYIENLDWLKDMK